MIPILCCGKGGVGKTTSAVSIALYLANKGETVTIIDHDGGHSVMKTLGMTSKIPSNDVGDVLHNLQAAVIDKLNYIGIADWKESGKPIERYFAQFPGDLGLLALIDLVNAFFGVPTDMITTQKFAVLVKLLYTLEEKRITNVIIDVEPTAGLERLLSNAKATVRSLRNLRNQGLLSLTMLAVKWPDIAAYLRGEYISNAENYCTRIERTVRLLKQAMYFSVCIPEDGPVDQMVEVTRIVEGFGGRISGCIVNNIRGEPHEARALASLPPRLPLVKITRREELHDGSPDRLTILRSMGREISLLLSNKQ